jgi:hypothetical protein
MLVADDRAADADLNRPRPEAGPLALDDVSHALSERFRILWLPGADHQEFIPAPPAEDVAAAHALLQRVRDGGDDMVSEVVTVHVIGLLQPDDVQEHCEHELVVAIRDCDETGNVPLDPVPIE